MQISRRTVLASSAAAAQSTAARPPNIVFLISDDHTAADLGCYGNTHVHTPNLDKLAREGARFTNCFVTSAQCSPNRSAIFTGCTSHTTGTSRLHAPMPPWEKTFVDLLKEHGYFTGAFRKVHQGDEFNKRFDFYAARPAKFESFFDKAPKDKPFFLHVGFTDPHRPYTKGAFTPPHDPAKVRLPNFLPDTPAIREDLAHYHDFIARMDAECGTLLALLESRGLASNTIVFFTGDNGMPFPGAKGTCYDPGIHVPLIVKWPGMTKPGEVRSELISHVDLAPTWLDIAGAPVPPKMQGKISTGLWKSGGFQAREAVFSERNWHDNFDPIRSIRTRRFKLIFNAAPHFPYRPAWDLEGSPSWSSYQAASRRPGFKPHFARLLQPARPIVEMYDLSKDPDEFNNIANDPAYAKDKQELLKRLSDWMHDTYDYLPPAFARPGEPAGRGWPVSL
ncbi:MAG: sulfatase [Acidobacteria bacterium]|nr:sulfatase [Acidobacteriota bacterium]